MYAHIPCISVVIRGACLIVLNFNQHISCYVDYYIFHPATPTEHNLTQNVPPKVEPIPGAPPPPPTEHLGNLGP